MKLPDPKKSNMRLEEPLGSILSSDLFSRYQLVVQFVCFTWAIAGLFFRLYNTAESKQMFNKFCQ